MKSEKVALFVLKLISLTKSRELDWNGYSPRHVELPNGDVILDKIYDAKLNARQLQLYRYKSKYFIDEENYNWEMSMRLTLLDNSGSIDYEFGYDNSLNDLYDIVREHTSKISDFIDDIVGGLRIINAVYYTANKSLNVTSQLEQKIFQDKLNIKVSNEIAGDPDPGTAKKLRVSYKVDGVTHEVEFEEGKKISLP